jgi:hypothetical protein
LCVRECNSLCCDKCVCVYEDVMILLNVPGTYLKRKQAFITSHLLTLLGSLMLG